MVRASLGGKESYFIHAYTHTHIHTERERERERERESKGRGIYFFIYLAHVYQIDFVLAPQKVDVPLTTRMRLGDERVRCVRDHSWRGFNIRRDGFWVEHSGIWFMGCTTRANNLDRSK